MQKYASLLSKAPLPDRHLRSKTEPAMPSRLRAAFLLRHPTAPMSVSGSGTTSANWSSPLELDRISRVPADTSNELTMSDLRLFRQVMRHFAMGSSIGPIFAAALLALNSQHVFDAVLNSSAPTTNLIIMVIGVSAYFGFGAAITGFVFIVMAEDSRKKL
jgi:hypothetical protein